MDGWMDGKLRWNFSAPSLSLRWAEPRQIRSIRSGPFLAVWNCSAPTGSLPYVPFSQNFGRFGFFSAALLCRSVGEWDGEYYAGRRIWGGRHSPGPGQSAGVCGSGSGRWWLVDGVSPSCLAPTDSAFVRRSLSLVLSRQVPSPVLGRKCCAPNPQDTPAPVLVLVLRNRQGSFGQRWSDCWMQCSACCGPGERQELFGSRGWLIRGCVWRCVWCVCVCA